MPDLRVLRDSKRLKPINIPSFFSRFRPFVPANPADRGRMRRNTTPRIRSTGLLQLRVLRLGLLQDGDVGVGVFPEGKEVLIGGASFRGAALHREGSAQI
jgi:hypothetical protein